MNHLPSPATRLRQINPELAAWPAARMRAKLTLIEAAGYHWQPDQHHFRHPRTLMVLRGEMLHRFEDRVIAAWGRSVLGVPPEAIATLFLAAGQIALFVPVQLALLVTGTAVCANTLWRLWKRPPANRVKIPRTSGHPVPPLARQPLQAGQIHQGSTQREIIL